MSAVGIRELVIQEDASILTWFGIGGAADRLAQPLSTDQLRQCLEIDPNLRVLGDGANLLVNDLGVSELVVKLNHGSFTQSSIDRATGTVRVGAGVNLPRLVLDTVREGLGGLEGLGGIPATVGGALVMNAGGAYGQIGDCVARVFVMDRAGHEQTIEAQDIAFGYRQSGLNEFIVTGAELVLEPGDPAALRERLKEVMAYKKSSQPMAEKSAGCCFKNPTLAGAIEDAGEAGQRVSAGLLIDRAGCKGMEIGGARVSDRHGNFIVTTQAATAKDVIELMDSVQKRVVERFGVELESEVVVWRRSS